MSSEILIVTAVAGDIKTLDEHGERVEMWENKVFYVPEETGHLTDRIVLSAITSTTSYKNFYCGPTYNSSFPTRIQFRKADWKAFRKELDDKVENISPESKYYD